MGSEGMAYYGDESGMCAGRHRASDPGVQNTSLKQCKRCGAYYIGGETKCVKCMTNLKSAKAK